MSKTTSDGDGIGAIEELWRSYRKKVIHPKATAEQLRQLRTAFYGGFIVMYTITERLGEPDVSEAEGIKTLEGLRHETLEFLKTQKVNAQRGN